MGLISLEIDFIGVKLVIYSNRRVIKSIFDCANAVQKGLHIHRD